ncbi:MAG: ATP-binding cassette domain-containing protein, partial [Spongiibacteraceae bacterium]|nr:ATP-binding cassette domain-containing protein [Spongiibacteraceae bacterium]
MSALVRLDKVAVQRDGQQILDNVSLAVARGEIVTIIGPNGAGKTTLLRVVLGLQTAQRGSVTRAPGLRVGYMPQKL